jgi:hypothetical protein
MDEASTLEGTRAQCDRIGELEVIQNLAKDGIWGNDLNRARPFAQAWLREQEWKRQKGTEADARRALQAAWFSAIAAVVSAITAIIAIARH